MAKEITVIPTHIFAHRQGQPLNIGSDMRVSVAKDLKTNAINKDQESKACGFCIRSLTFQDYGR